MSGHYATLLRGTVETMLTTHDVYITDWVDARDVPLLALGSFDLDDYIDYVIEMFGHLGPNVSRDGGVPAFRACSGCDFADVGAKDPCLPATMTLMGGTNRHAAQPDGREQALRIPKSCLVPAQCDQESAVSQCRHDARCLSRIPAADRLHDHEP